MHADTVHSTINNRTPAVHLPRRITRHRKDLDVNDTTPAGGLGLLEHTDTSGQVASGWNLILWNDPVNQMAYVTGILCEVLAITTDEAERHMLTAHLDGKAAIYNGDKEKAAAYAAALGSYNLWASVEKAGT